MKFFHNIYIAFLVLFLSILVFGYSIFNYSLSKISNNDKLKEVVIEPGSIDSIATTLKKENLIKSKFSFKLYVQLTGKSNLKAAKYSLSEDMGTKKIINILYKGTGENTSQIKITFKEGLNMRAIAKVIEENTSHTQDEVYKVLDDMTYLNTLIEDYWFIKEDILKENIYYSLEGYLYPSTYYFSSKDVKIEEIFRIMLNETEKQLKKYKKQIEENNMTVHELLTLASIVELEGVTLEDKKGIARVFYNRLKDNISLGSDVTTYYGLQIDMGDRDLYSEEVKKCNAYNTRCVTFSGLPISPVCNPSIDAITAVIEPDDSNYYYFVADCFDLCHCHCQYCGGAAVPCIRH